MVSTNTALPNGRKPHFIAEFHTALFMLLSYLGQEAKECESQPAMCAVLILAWLWIQNVADEYGVLPRAKLVTGSEIRWIV